MPKKPTKNPTNHYFSSQTPLLDAQQQAASSLLSISAIGHTLQFLTGEGVFARSGLDAGSRLLLESMNHQQTDQAEAKFCDLGCGWGAVGAFWAKNHPTHQVVALDVNPRAAQLAQGNFRRNSLPNATALCADGLDCFGDDSFDFVACNPPIRAGNATIARLFEGSHRVLKPSGVLWVVIRTAQGAKSWQKRLEALFGNCETVEIDAGYRILRAVK